MRCNFSLTPTSRAQLCVQIWSALSTEPSERSLQFSRYRLADTHADTEAAYEQYFKAMREFEGMRNRRATESIVFEAWRSLNSNRRQGG
jgi:hypothetical protein